jgi:hypothetical protein
MLAGSEFRHHAAVFAMNIDLGCDNIREDVASIGDDGRSRFVAR